jgi:hypothetical protein
MLPRDFIIDILAKFIKGGTAQLKQAFVLLAGPIDKNLCKIMLARKFLDVFIVYVNFH